MKTAIVKQYGKYAFLLGPILFIMGLTAGLVAGSWGAIPIGLLLAGLIISLGWVVTQRNGLQGFLGRRSTQEGTNALISIVAFLLILGMINFLGVRYARQIDVTENQLFTLSPQTVEVVQSLEQPTKIWIFDALPDPQDQALLTNYQRENSQFSYEYIDPQAQPGVVQEFGVQAPGEVYLEIGDERRYLQTLSPQERLSERQLTNGLVQLINPNPAKLYFLQGHGERSLQPGQGSLSQAIARLTEENYQTEPLNLAEATTVPEDADVVVVAGPQRSLLEVEIEALKDYMQRPSGLVVLADPQTETDLSAILGDWGIGFGDYLITDPAGEAANLGVGVPIVTQYADHPITQEFQGGYSFYPLAQPVSVTPKEGVTATPIIYTSDRSRAERIAGDGQLEFNPATDPVGPLVLGVAASRPVEESDATPPAASPSPTTEESPTAEEASPEASPSPEESEEGAEASEDATEARLVVIGNSSFATDGIFPQQLNGDVFLNSVSWASQQDDQILSIRPKEFNNRRLLLNAQQQILMVLLALVALPLLGFGLAIALWWTRR